MKKKRTKSSKELIQGRHGVKRGKKLQEVLKRRREKQKKIKDKRRNSQQQREIRRKCRAGNEKDLPTCQALNRFQRRCKSKILGQSSFCKIHQFYDSETSGLAQCLGRNKFLKRCINSVALDEKYCNYHKIANQSEKWPVDSLIQS